MLGVAAVDRQPGSICTGQGRRSLEGGYLTAVAMGIAEWVSDANGSGIICSCGVASAAGHVLYWCRPEECYPIMQI